MTTAELNDQFDDTTSPEEMKQMVEDIAAERKGEEPKSDAQITSEQAGKPADDEPPAETDSGSDDTAPEGEDTATVEDQGDDTGDEEASWLDDDLKAEAAAYGIEESEIADFASREELERALRLFDKSALEAGRKALAEPEGEDGGDRGDGRTEKGQFAKQKKEEPKADPPAEREGQYEFKLDTDRVWDEEAAKDLTEAVSGLRDHYDSRLAVLEERLRDSEARFAEADAKAEERVFDDAIDKLKHTSLFGKTGSESKEQMQRRSAVLSAVRKQIENYGTGDYDLWVGILAKGMFADEFDKQLIKKKTRKVSKQSNGRQGGGATRPQDPREDPRDEADRLYRELDRA